MVAGVPALYVGMLALVAGAVLVLWLAHRAIERGGYEAPILTAAAAALSLLAFALLTRMHERYMFYSLAVLVPLVFIRPLRLAFVALSGIFVLNLWWVLAYFNAGASSKHCGLPGPGCFGIHTIFGLAQQKLCSIAVTAIAIALACFGVRWAARTKTRARIVRG